MYRITKTVGIIAILVLLVGTAQAGDWPMFQHDSKHTGYTTEKVPDELELLWSYDTRSILDSSPAVANGKVFVASGDGKIYCLDEDTGNLIWSYKAGWGVDSSPAVANGKVFVGSMDNKVYCLDEDTGNLIWSYTTGGSIWGSSPAVANGKVFVGSKDNKVYCLDEDTGNLIWSYTTEHYVSSSPAVADGRVFVGPVNAKVYCLDEDTGNLIWSYKAGYGGGSSPAVADGKVFVGYVDGNICCLDEDTGNLIWSYSIEGSVHSSPAVANGKVFVGSKDYNYKVYCLDEDTGNLIWSYSIEDEVYSPPTVADGKVFVAVTNAHKVCCLDEDTGNLIWSYTTGGTVLSSPAVANGKVFVGSGDNKIYCFGAVSTPTSIPPLYILGAAAVIAIILIAGIAISRKGKKGKSTKPQPPVEQPKPKTEPAKQKSIIKKETPPPISESLTIERAIYDPCKRDFVEGRLPRMKEWINRYDPGAYWFAVSIQNNTDKAIEEWGVELAFSSALKIKEAKIEGIEIEIPHETHLGLFKISVPKEYGIVIPQKGAQRVYFKLRADKPKTTYEISGVFKSAITGDVPIRAKEFKYWCDAGVSPEAVKAELKKTFSEKDAARIANTFRISQEIRSSYCSTDTTAKEINKEFDLLKMYLTEKEFLDEIGGIQRRINAELREDERLDEKHVKEVKDFCEKFTEMWIAKFLR